MKTVGLFEAKTKLSELCQEVAATGEPCIITRRGEPLVRLEAVHDPRATRESLWAKRDRHLRGHGRLAPQEADFELPAPVATFWRDPLAWTLK